MSSLNVENVSTIADLDTIISTAQKRIELLKNAWQEKVKYGGYI